MSEADSDFEWQTHVTEPCLDVEVDPLAEPTVFTLFDWANDEAWIRGESVDLEGAR